MRSKVQANSLAPNQGAKETEPPWVTGAFRMCDLPNLSAQGSCDRHFKRWHTVLPIKASMWPGCKANKVTAPEPAGHVVTSSPGAPARLSHHLSAVPCPGTSATSHSFHSILKAQKQNPTITDIC